MPSLAYSALLAEAASAAQKFAAPTQPKKVIQDKTPSLWQKFMAGARLLFSPQLAVVAMLLLVVGLSLTMNDQINPTAPSMSEESAAVPKQEPQRNKEGATPAPIGAPKMDPVAVVEPAPEVPVEFKSTVQTKAPNDAGEKNKKDRDENEDQLFVAKDVPSAPKPVTTTTPPANASGSLGGDSTKGRGTPPTDDKVDPVAYQNSLNLGNQAYNAGNYQEANKQYQSAATNAADGSTEESTALAAQAQAQASLKECDAALATARQITGATQGAALLAAADCYAAQNNNDKAKELYTEIAKSNSDASTEARRMLTTLETKLSKPSLEAPKTNLPAKNAKKTKIQNQAESNK
jgi:hypothetical protein